MRYIIKKNKCKENCNCIMDNGNYLSEDWFDYIGTFYCEWARVVKNRKWNFINLSGKFISDEWFDDCDDFSFFGYMDKKNNTFSTIVFCGLVQINKDRYLIDTNGNILLETPNIALFTTLSSDPNYEEIE